MAAVKRGRARDGGGEEREVAIAVGAEPEDPKLSAAITAHVAGGTAGAGAVAASAEPEVSAGPGARGNVQRRGGEEGEGGGSGVARRRGELGGGEVEILRAECNFLRMEREVVLQKQAKNPHQMEAAMRSAMGTLISALAEDDAISASIPVEVGNEQSVSEAFGNLTFSSDPVENVKVGILKQNEATISSSAKENGLNILNTDRNLDLQQCKLVNDFLHKCSNQLSIYGYILIMPSCLKEGLWENELCVFYRNNHFRTMLKFEGELYLLVTDQGYINHPDLVREKLSEVNGDTVFMTTSPNICLKGKKVMV